MAAVCGPAPAGLQRCRRENKPSDKKEVDYEREQQIHLDTQFRFPVGTAVGFLAVAVDGQGKREPRTGQRQKY